MLIARVAIPSPLRRLFDYRLEQQHPAPGVRVQVPFGARQLVGLVIEVTNSSPITVDKLKPVTAILDEQPLLPDYLLDLALWAADYYQHPVGDALLHCLPVYLRKGGKDTPPQQHVWQISTAPHAASFSARAHQQRKLFELIAAHPEGVSSAELKAAGGSTTTLRTLANKGLIKQILQPAHTTQAAALLNEAPLTLNPEQQRALDPIITQHGYAAFLLEGVTGSGKTEIYLQAIAHVLQQGQQALILIPEIGLTPQTVQRFSRRFNVPVCVLHSHLSDKQRFAAWSQARAGQARIIIGTRSAIFTPLQHPGIIIVDEEHDVSFKQQEGFRYSARDLALVRAHAEAIPIVLGSATPALESLHNALSGRYHHLVLTQRAGNAQPPTFSLLDIRREPLHNGLSQALIEQIRQHLQQGTQVLVFINRRGFAPSLICHDCGQTADCRRCDARMTLHRQPAHLHCHHCNSQRPIPHRCEHCGSTAIEAVGAGTERCEQTLATLFPETPVLRIDRDSTRRKGSLSQMMTHIHSGQPCILVGTQMLAKGHHFPKVTLVAIPDADAGLFSTDFRAMERTAQLLLQVAGRAGRANHPGQVILQTHQAEHPLLRCLITQGYSAFARQTLGQRQQFGLPPFAYLAIIRAQASKPARAESFLQTLRTHQQPQFAYVHWSGPFPAPMEKRAGVYRAQLTLSCPSRPALQHALTQLCHVLEQHPLASRVRWSVDVDPCDMH